MPIYGGASRLATPSRTYPPLPLSGPTDNCAACRKATRQSDLGPVPGSKHRYCPACRAKKTKA